MRGFRKGLSDEERRAYDRHARKVASAITQWKDAAGRAVPAPKGLVNQVRLGAWEAPRISALMEREMRESARLFHEEGHDVWLDSRVRKISLARCLLELVDKMRSAAVKSNNSALILGVNSLQSKMVWLMDDSYFIKGEEQIIDGVLDLHPDLVACGRLTGVEVPGIHRMMDRHRIDTASTIGDYAVELDEAARARELAAQ